MKLSYLISAVLAPLLAMCVSLTVSASVFQSTSTVSAKMGACLLTALECAAYGQETDLLLGRWGQAVDPAKDCKFECASEKLTIGVPGTYHGLSTLQRVNNLLAPRVLQDVAGDFSIEVKLRCFDPPASGSSTNPASATDSFVGSGLLIWQNEKNFIRLTQAAIGDRQQKVIQLRVVDRLIFEETYKFDAEHLYLRIFRIGKTFGASVSEDGRRWLTPSVSTMPTLFERTYAMRDRLRAGVVVVNSINQEIQGQFEDLKISDHPEANSHDYFKPNWVFPRSLLRELRDPQVQQELHLDAKALALLAEPNGQQQSSNATVRTTEDSQATVDQAAKAWVSLRPMLLEHQTQRLAGLAVQRFGPRSLLLDVVQERLKLDELQLKSIARARELLEEAILVRKTPETESAYSNLRQQANKLLMEVASGATQERMDELSGDLFSFSLPGMIVPKALAIGHPLGPLAELIRQPGVQQELRLSREAIEAIDELLTSKSKETIGMLPSLEFDFSENPSPLVISAWVDAYGKISALRKEIELECNKRLSLKQNSRLQQILFQALGPQTLLVSASACDALEITANQREGLQQIEQSLAKSQNLANLICKSLGRSDEVTALLTETQRQQVEGFKGTTFHFLAVPR